MNAFNDDDDAQWLTTDTKPEMTIQCKGTFWKLGYLNMYVYYAASSFHLLMQDKIWLSNISLLMDLKCNCFANS